MEDYIRPAAHDYLHLVRERWTSNLAETGHPLHHLTRSGAIVGDDPRAHVMHEEHLWEAGIYLDAPKPWRHPKKPVKKWVADWYGTKAGKAWLRKNSTAQVVQAVPPVQRSLWA